VWKDLVHHSYSMTRGSDMRSEREQHSPGQYNTTERVVQVSTVQYGAAQYSAVQAVILQDTTDKSMGGQDRTGQRCTYRNRI
jgi:hypothetical protein